MSIPHSFGGKTPPVHMPKVDVPADVEALFKTARMTAAGQPPEPLPTPGRHVVVVTPGRMLMLQPCPPEGSIPAKDVAPIEKMISPAVKRNIAAIAFTQLNPPATLVQTVPFLGILLGFAYIGHAVWIFEGHPSALAAGCRDADVLIVDDAMVPHLQADWKTVAAGAMRRAEVYIHERATRVLHKA